MDTPDDPCPAGLSPLGRREHDLSPYGTSCLRCGRPLRDPALELDEDRGAAARLDDDRKLDAALRARPGGYRRLGRVRPAPSVDQLPTDPDPEDDDQ